MERHNTPYASLEKIHRRYLFLNLCGKTMAIHQQSSSNVAGGAPAHLTPDQQLCLYARSRDAGRINQKISSVAELNESSIASIVEGLVNPTYEARHLRASTFLNGLAISDGDKARVAFGAIAHVTGNADFGALGAYHLALDLSAFVSENKLTVPADLLSKIEALSLKLRTTEIHHHEDPLSWYATRQSNELRKAFGIPPFVSDRERSQLFDEKFSEVEEVQRHDRSPSVSRPACVGIAAAVIAVAGFACFEGLRASSLPRDSVSTPERSPGKEPDRDTLAKAEKAAIEIQNAHSTVAQIFEISTGVKLDAFVSGTASPESLLRLDKLVLSRTKMGDLSARSLDNLRELSGEINEKLKSWEAEPNKTDLKATALLTWADGTMERLDSLAEEARIVGTFLKSSSEAWE